MLLVLPYSYINLQHPFLIPYNFWTILSLKYEFHKISQSQYWSPTITTIIFHFLVDFVPLKYEFQNFPSSQYWSFLEIKIFTTYRSMNHNNIPISVFCTFKVRLSKKKIPFCLKSSNISPCHFSFLTFLTLESGIS